MADSKYDDDKSKTKAVFWDIVFISAATSFAAWIQPDSRSETRVQSKMFCEAEVVCEVEVP